MSKLDSVIGDLKAGKIVLISDSDDRENETDMVISSSAITPAKVATLRQDAGGLICVSIGKNIAERLGLPYMHDVQETSSEKYSILKQIVANDIPYDEKSSFSVTVNHRKTFTGITDVDRALTIAEIAKLCDNPDPLKFGKDFRSPGHVSLLISSGLDARKGHTELSTALMELAGLTQCVTICEMLDSKTHKSKSNESAAEYAAKNNLTIVDTKTIEEAYTRR